LPSLLSLPLLFLLVIPEGDLLLLLSLPFLVILTLSEAEGEESLYFARIATDS
jgi:hypothetical protein